MRGSLNADGPLVATVDGKGGPKTRVFVVGSDNTVYAIDSETGEVTWQKRFPESADAEAGGYAVLFQYSERHAGNR